MLLKKSIKILRADTQYNFRSILSNYISIDRYRHGRFSEWSLQREYIQIGSELSNENHGKIIERNDMMAYWIKNIQQGLSIFENNREYSLNDEII